MSRPSDAQAMAPSQFCAEQLLKHFLSSPLLELKTTTGVATFGPLPLKRNCLLTRTRGAMQTPLTLRWCRGHGVRFAAVVGESTGGWAHEELWRRVSVGGAGLGPAARLCHGVSNCRGFEGNTHPPPLLRPACSPVVVCSPVAFSRQRLLSPPHYDAFSRTLSLRFPVYLRSFCTPSSFHL